jgi:hypothetical protein
VCHKSRAYLCQVRCKTLGCGIKVGLLQRITPLFISKATVKTAQDILLSVAKVPVGPAHASAVALHKDTALQRHWVLLLV